jgi:hypothetical protein
MDSGTSRAAGPRQSNSVGYRWAHWPIWAAVFFILPGPRIVRLLAAGFGLEHAVWLGLVVFLTVLAGLLGKLPGMEPTPYVVRIGEDKANPLYRRICYTAAWIGILTYLALNLAGLVDVLAGGVWHLQKMYRVAYFPVAGVVGVLGALGLLPMAKRRIGGEAAERRSFYGLLSAVAISQPIFGILSQVLAQTRSTYAIELILFLVTFTTGLLWGRRLAMR